jgi:biotin synthase
MSTTHDLLACLESEHALSRRDWVDLIENRTPDDESHAAARARAVARSVFGNAVYLRGIVEFTNICRNDCLYCGLRRSNAGLERYRLSPEEILACCQRGYDLGFRTFVLQGGEDLRFDDEHMVPLVAALRDRFPSCAITLSLGERSHESCQALFDAGANRYLLRHETASPAHYARLHPADMSFEHRIGCLWDLKGIGYQVGAGMMVGSPFQTTDDLAADMLFLHELQPQMVGLGPFIPHHATPFAGERAGTLADTLFLLSCVRLMLPGVLLPATTALGTIAPDGRERGILAGANVVMPSLTPRERRGDYLLYDNKICVSDDSAACIGCMRRRMESIGYRAVVGRGDAPGFGPETRGE